MMNRTLNTLISLLLSMLLTASCIDHDYVSESGEKTELDDEYLIFGTYYGFSIGGGSINTYKLTKDALYIDNSNSWDIDKA